MVMAMSAIKLDPDELRTKFVVALSDMYRSEVPLYGKLVDIVREVDRSVASAGNGRRLPIRHELERHGAIRLGTEYELHTIRRLFGIIGMYPVGYYDLGVVDFPLHATAFRPITEESLEKNPFRVFTTLLRKERLSPKVAATTESILAGRNLFTSRLLDIIDRIESSLPVTPQDAEDLITDSLKIFKWHSKSDVTIGQYLALKQEHPMVADIVCFPSAHINHLTPRTLDINLVQEEMVRQEMPAKDRIEGPPARQCPILLRQTSFKALEEPVIFGSSEGSSAPGTHTARFGEVEQRGAALTPKGRELYDQLLNLTRESVANTNGATHGKDFDTLLLEHFSQHYPDSWSELQARCLVYFRYQPTSSGREFSKSPEFQPRRVHLTELLTRGLVEYEPITYEDFLPFSAAGIFKSNMREDPETTSVAAAQKESTPGNVGSEQREALEAALGCKILDEYELYAALERQSIRMCERELNLQEIIIS
ncbi:hypothetical protein CLAIMM_11791 [Cladophialophora immunda]|nr:hypothetical protein CLAIMM_11791 [Cladophialophora immunda]